MAESSLIEWTDATWNPITGCSVVSPGCTNCYAMRLAGTRLQAHPSRAGLTRDSKAGPVWTGEVRFNEAWLTQPLAWKRPRRIFVCAHADLFHEAVPDAWLDRVFAVMALAPQHAFQVLTKRAGRMRAYLSDPSVMQRWGDAEMSLGIASTAAQSFRNAARFVLSDAPLPNVWLGVSAEDQRRADERVPELLATPAAVRFVSAEPLLGATDLTKIDVDGDSSINALSPASAADLWASDWDPAVTGTTLEEAIEGFRDWGFSYPPSTERPPGLDLVIVGGENGPRPMHPAWALSIRDQCAAAGVPFFFKQWGSWKPICAMTEAETNALYKPNRIARAGEDQGTLEELYGRTCTVPVTAIGYGGAVGLDAFIQVDGHGGMTLFGVGKKAAGRLLDGVEHNGMPRGTR